MGHGEIAFAACLAAMRVHLLPAQLTANVTKIYDRPPLPAPWGMGRVTLLGDAAHPVLPTLGQVCGARAALRCSREGCGRVPMHARSLSRQQAGCAMLGAGPPTLQPAMMAKWPLPLCNACTGRLHGH
jgi:hypothetical protein